VTAVSAAMAPGSTGGPSTGYQPAISPPPARHQRSSSRPAMSPLVCLALSCKTQLEPLIGTAVAVCTPGRDTGSGDASGRRSRRLPLCRSPPAQTPRSGCSRPTPAGRQQHGRPNAGPMCRQRGTSAAWTSQCSSSGPTLRGVSSMNVPTQLLWTDTAGRQQHGRRAQRICLQSASAVFLCLMALPKIRRLPGLA
jgi:hypothetical protein